MRTFLKDTRGNVALIFALALLPIALVVGASIDLSRMRVERTKLQSALDAAVLAAARMPVNSSDEAIDAVIDDYLAANYVGEGTVAQRVITRSGSGGIQVDAAANVPMTFGALLGADIRAVTAMAAAERGGVNLEISLVLDVTGSMQYDLDDLQAASTLLINSVVQDVQTPYYSKAAIIPYSAAVNMGDLADEARGDPVPPKLITDMDRDLASSPRNIKHADDRNPVRIETTTGHGLQDGNYVYIEGLEDMTNLNGGVFKVDRRSSDEVDLYEPKYGWSGIDGTQWGWGWDEDWYSGTIQKCASTCELMFESEDHGFSEDDWVYVQDVGGQPLIDGPYQVGDTTTDRLELEDAKTTGAYTSGGTIDCTHYGCPYYRFNPPWGSAKVWELTNCVAERTGSEAYTDAAPSTAPVGMIYAASADGGDCPDQEIMPLTSDKTALLQKIEDLTTGGTTAGQIGIAWGWYTLSPNFNEMWPAGSDAAAYGAPQTLKVAVIMTDGAFNTAYCDGAKSDDYSGSWWGGEIDCDSNNGDPFDQAKDLCDGMKDAGITIYTVGYNLTADSEEEEVMEYCATGGSANAFLASNGAALQTAFASIGESIGQLRLTR